MGKPILLLRLEGPLQSWGSRSRWDVRDTQPEPTKSGIVGLLGCALGYERGDRRLEEELDGGLRFGVRVEQPGRVLEDFQTVTDFLPTAAGEFRVSGGTRSAPALRSDREARPATILSPRFYLEDASFLVALEGVEAGSDLLPRCASALQRPAWTLFLGRKACVPTRPIFEALTAEYEDLEQALRHHRWSCLAACRESRPVSDADLDRWLEAYLEDPAGALTRQDAVRLNTARQYGFRQVRRLDPPVTLRDVHAVTLRDVCAKEVR